MPRNIALVGCGAIARAFYLPALAKHRAEFGHLWFVDPSDHAVSNAASVVPGSPAHKLTDVDDEINLVIVASPNHLHFQIAYEALSRGADVLIEKPFVICPKDGRKLVEAAAANGRVIVVNQTRRLFPIARDLRRRLGEGEFGALKSIVHWEGTKLNWPFESGAAFSRGAQRTGVIMDFGVHVIDFYHYLLEPTWTFISAIHDGFNGPEGLAEIELRANKVPISIRLSRYHAQENIAHLIFERADVSFGVFDSATYFVRSDSGKPKSFAIGNAKSEYSKHAESLLLNFLAATEKREPAICDARSALPVIDILDEIYRSARRYPENFGSV
jgi:UDP-N-acetylglucosamine 3-dehydrogenase